MPITVTNWKRLSPLLDVALDLPPAERDAWLASLPPEHVDLRSALAELLDARRAVETDDFLNRLPAFSGLPASLFLGPGSTVGPYRLLRELGAGGTASVWLAERVDGSIQRQVALKLPHVARVVGLEQRIARETQILARLEHPNIARLYDAGVDDGGRPWLALEYVDGLPPDQYCRTGRLGLEAKLALFLDILRAVAFAHAHLIVHRDLKPNNILVAPGGHVRLLDFGIARLLQPDPPAPARAVSAVAPQPTLVGAAALTPAYAAPEQFAGQPITVATDVYSLGVILFEMITGVSPYSPKGHSLGAYEHEVLQVDAPLMSRVARPAEAPALRGDLDAIVAKALEKSPADRYASVEAFARDIERHLAAEPVAAQPRSFGYLARKFVRRNAVALGIGALVACVLGAALAVAANQWIAAERQRAIAVDRLADSDAAVDFTSTVLIEGMQPGESLTFEDLIARSEVIARQAGRDDLRTRIFATDFLSSWYGANGLTRNAESILTQAIDSLAGEPAQLGAALRCKRAVVWSRMGRRQDALATLGVELAANYPDDAVASKCLVARADLALSGGDGDGALRFAHDGLRRFELAGVDTVYGRSDILLLIGAAHSLRDEFPAAHAKYREALRILAGAGRERGRAAANVHDDWSAVWMNQGNPRRALEETDLGWQIAREQSPNARIADTRIYRRGRILVQLGRFDEAMDEFARARSLAVDRGNVLTLIGVDIGEADVAVAQGRLNAAAVKLDDATLEIRRTDLPADHVLVSRHLVSSAVMHGARGNAAEARRLFTDAVSNYQSKGCCRANQAWALALRGEAALLQGDVDAAAADAALARERAPPVEMESFSRFTGRAWYLTALVHEHRRQAREARDAFATAAVQFAGALGDRHHDTLLARAGMSRASELLAGTKKP
jgi:serine/threonine-protein kinase